MPEQRYANSPEDKTKDELEAIYGNGFADEISGDVEAPTGHFYRVGHQIVHTDSQGFTDVNTYTSVEHAEIEFDRWNEEYMEWDTDDEEDKNAAT